MLITFCRSGSSEKLQCEAHFWLWVSFLAWWCASCTTSSSSSAACLHCWPVVDAGGGAVSGGGTGEGDGIKRGCVAIEGATGGGWKRKEWTSLMEGVVTMESRSFLCMTFSTLELIGVGVPWDALLPRKVVVIATNCVRHVESMIAFSDWDHVLARVYVVAG